MNGVRSLLSMRDMLLQRDRLMTVGLSRNGCSHSKNRFDEREQDWLAQKLSCGDLKGLMWFRQSLLFSSSLKKTTGGSARGMRKKMLEKDSTYMIQIRSFMSMHGMLPGYSLGLIAKHLLQRVRLWPSLYQIAGTRTRISLFDKRLIRSEVWAAVTSKVWRDSGRAFFSPPPEGDKRRLCRVILALLEEEVKSCRSLFEFGYCLF